MRYEPIPDDERPGTGLVCNLCRAPVGARPCRDHAEFGTDADRFAAFGVCGRCGRGGRCDGSCGCGCAHLHRDGRLHSVDGQTVLDLATPAAPLYFPRGKFGSSPSPDPKGST